MNPSATGWINKHIPVFLREIVKKGYSDEQFYHELKINGFIYANSIATISYPNGTTYSLTPQEISKVNLFDSLGYVFFKLYPQASVTEYVESAVEFYNYLKDNSWFTFQLPFIKQSPEEKLESIIQRRVQTTETAFQKNFSALIANALLYLDVLTYEHYLKTDINPIDFAKSLEALIANTIYLALKQKSKKSTYEELVLNLIESSLRYNRIDEVSLSYDKLNYHRHQSPMERLYILDLACLAVYADETLENKERRFILKLAQLLGFNKEETKGIINEALKFIDENSKRITYLDARNPFRNLYDNTSRMVRTLIVRNKKRLTTELRESKELVELLGKSTTTELNIEEKEKVKEQLLDICKVIPSFTVFMLPGGMILLPLLVKLIPALLPSAFMDNKTD